MIHKAQMISLVSRYHRDVMSYHHQHSSMKASVPILEILNIARSFACSTLFDGSTPRCFEKTEAVVDGRAGHRLEWIFNWERRRENTQGRLEHEPQGSKQNKRYIE